MGNESTWLPVWQQSTHCSCWTSRQNNTIIQFINYVASNSTSNTCCYYAISCDIKKNRSSVCCGVELLNFWKLWMCHENATLMLFFVELLSWMYLWRLEKQHVWLCSCFKCNCQSYILSVRRRWGLCIIDLLIIFSNEHAFCYWACYNKLLLSSLCY